MSERTEAMWRWLAWRLPRQLVKWAFFRVAAHATTGRWGGECPCDTKLMDAAGRWDEP